MYQLYILIVLILGSVTVEANPINEIYNSEKHQRGNALCEASDGGWLIGGYSKTAGSKRGDFLILRTDQAGSVQWQLELGEKSRDEECFAVVQLGEVEWLIAGSQWRSNKRKPGKEVTGIVHAITDSGVVQWSQEIRDVEIRGAALVQDRVCLTGATRGGLAWLCLMNKTGEILWTKTDFPGDSSHIRDLAVLSDTSIALVGYQRLDGEASSTAWCAVVNMSGELVAQARSGTPDDFFRSVACRNGEIVCGGASGTRVFFNGARIFNSFVLRLDAQCTPLDSLRLVSDGFDIIQDLALTDTTVICTGIASVDPMSPDFRKGVLGLSLTRNLEIRWNAGQPGIRRGAARAILPTDEGFIIAGLTEQGVPSSVSNVLLLSVSADRGAH
jgi:hypothetical protein